MKLYFPYDGKISRAMERIRRAFIGHSPPGVRFLDQMDSEAIHCLNWVGQNPREHTKTCEVIQGVPTLPLGSRYIVFAHVGNPHYVDLDQHYRRILAGALLVVTYDQEILGYMGSNVLETPWGFEPSTFYRIPLQRGYKILCTGYVADSEAIDACVDACVKLGSRICHVGGSLRSLPFTYLYNRHENIQDSELRALYSSSEYVSGMRREGGFELPVIEGYGCGAQPIVFDHPTMRKWYSDFVLYVPNVPRPDLARVLAEILAKPGGVNPKQEILDRFNWRGIIAKIWTRILE